MGRRMARALALAVVATLCACVRLSDSANERAFEVSAAWVGGRPVVAWYGGKLGHEAIYLRRADMQGRWQGPAVRLTDASKDAFEPSLQDIDGDALVAWYEQEQAPTAVAPRQFVQVGRFDVSGRRIWQRRLSGEDVRGRIPVVRVAGNVVHVAWLEQRGDEPPMLRSAKLDAMGGWLSPPRDLFPAGRATWNLNAAIGPDGSMHVVFDTEAGRAKELEWIAAGAAHIARFASVDDGQTSMFPDIAIGGGRFAITWVDSRDGADEVYLRCGKLGPEGLPVAQQAIDATGAQRVTHTAGASTGAYAAWNGSGFELAWVESRGPRGLVMHQAFDADCRPRAKASPVDGWGSAGIPSLASSPAGLLLAWNGMRGDPASATSRVLLKIWPTPGVSRSAAAR